MMMNVVPLIRPLILRKFSTDWKLKHLKCGTFYSAVNFCRFPCAIPFSSYTRFTPLISTNSANDKSLGLLRYIDDKNLHIKLCRQIKADSGIKNNRENIYTIPNALCLIRIILSPVLGHMVVHEQYSWALCIFAFAGLTDLLDGFIARNVPGQMSNLGSALDPLADKLLVSVLFVSLTYSGLFPVWLTAIIILRDVILLLGGFYIRYATLDPPKTISRFFDVTQPSVRMKPTTISKINTGVQLTTVAATLAFQAFGVVDQSILHFAWYLTAATTVLSGLSYASIKDNYEKLKKE